MFATLICTLALALTPQSSGPAESPVAAVRAAYAKVEAAQAALPPAKDDSERLERLLPLDQAGRQAMRRIDVSGLPDPEREAARQAAILQIAARDRANLAALKAMLPAEGWFTKDRYSAAAREAAFLIVQHATADPPFMREALARMEPLVATGDVKGTSFAMLYDRVALQEGRPQRYGSQMTCKEGRWALSPLEDPAGVDERRKAVGFTATLAEYEAQFANMPACGG